MTAELKLPVLTLWSLTQYCLWFNVHWTLFCQGWHLADQLFHWLICKVSWLCLGLKRPSVFYGHAFKRNLTDPATQIPHTLLTAATRAPLYHRNSNHHLHQNLTLKVISFLSKFGSLFVFEVFLCIDLGRSAPYTQVNCRELIALKLFSGIIFQAGSL